MKKLFIIIFLLISFCISLGICECYFDGVDDIVLFPNNSNYNFQKGMTIMGWFYTTKDDWTFWISNSSEAIGGWRLALNPVLDEIRVLWEQRTTGLSERVSPNYTITYNKWFHYALIISTTDSESTTGENRSKLYINGKFVAEYDFFAGVTYFDTPNNLFIGWEQGANPAGYFGGSISDLIIINKALTENEVKSYADRKPISNKNTVLYISLDGANYNNKIAFDLSRLQNGIHIGTSDIKLPIPTLKLPIYAGN